MPFFRILSIVRQWLYAVQLDWPFIAFPTGLDWSAINRATRQGINLSPWLT
jgi:hypothetical protein